MKYLSKFGANMTLNKKIVDMDQNTNQQFQSVVPRKKEKNRLKH